MVGAGGRLSRVGSKGVREPPVASRRLARSYKFSAKEKIDVGDLQVLFG